MWLWRGTVGPKKSLHVTGFKLLVVLKPPGCSIRFSVRLFHFCDVVTSWWPLHWFSWDCVIGNRTIDAVAVVSLNGGHGLLFCEVTIALPICFLQWSAFAGCVVDHYVLESVTWEAQACVFLSRCCVAGDGG